jgi:hypothetical protein
MRKLILIPFVVVLASCTGTGEIYKEYNASTTSLSLDARQRVVFSVQRDGNTIICAEPSPDMFTVIDAERSSSVEAKTSSSALKPASALGGGSRNVAIKEAGIEVQNRSEVMQLLRDGMYRACEAYANGAIGKEEYKQIVSKQDDMLLTLIAVEQLGAQLKLGDTIEQVANDGLTANDAIRLIVQDYLCLQVGYTQMTAGMGFDRTLVDQICK